MIDWVWVAGLVVPSYLVQTFLHEGAHAVFAWKQGLRVTSFKIWPHFVRSKTSKRLFFGRVTYERKPGTSLTDAQGAWRAWAPFVVGLPLWTTLWALKLFWGDLESNGLLTCVAVYWTALSVDLVRGLLLAFTGKESLDVLKGAKYAKLPRWATRAIAGVTSAGMIAAWAIEMWPLVRASF